MFPRYLFVQLGTDIAGKSWSPIRSTLGVSRLVMFGNTPAKIDDDQMAVIQSYITSFKINQDNFEAGQEVVIGEGVFAGLKAVYQMSSGESRAIVLLEIMSKAVKMTVSANCIRALT